MKLKTLKNGAIRCRLANFPGSDELATMNSLATATFSIRTSRGYTELLSSEPTNALPCVMECPIQEWFTL